MAKKYTAKEVAAMRSAIYASLAKATGLSVGAMSGSFVEEVLKTYILAQVDASDLAAHCEGEINDNDDGAV